MAGAPGTPGATGPSGTITKSMLYTPPAASAPVTANNQGTAVAECTNVNDVVIAGFCSISQQGALISSGATNSNVTSVVSGWTCTGYNPTIYPTVTVVAGVTCLTVP